MAATPDDPLKNGPPLSAEELARERERLRVLAESLKAREEALAEMIENYPHLKRYAYDKLREELAPTDTELPPDKDLETIAREDGALPFEAFIDEIERIAEGR